MSNPPKADESMNEYLHRCDVISGRYLPRCTSEQIEQLKAAGYSVDSFAEPGVYPNEPFVQWMWTHTAGDFQDVEPSVSEEDCWACAWAHMTATDGGKHAK